MSTSSRSSVKRCAPRRARSSRSPTNRSSRSASAPITSSDSRLAAGSSTSPSRSASTWPRTAVSGVRSSWETDIRNFRSSSSASESRAAICRNRSVRWPISSPEGTSGTTTSYRPSATWSAARERPRTGFRSEEHTSELQSHHDLVCRLLLEKKKKKKKKKHTTKKKKKKK